MPLIIQGEDFPRAYTSKWDLGTIEYKHFQPNWIMPTFFPKKLFQFIVPVVLKKTAC